MKILNSEKEDYHIHSFNYSDGMNTVDEIVIFAGKIGMKKIAITDHCQTTIDSLGIAQKGLSRISNRWRNVHNDVEVIFGIEADLLNKDGDMCTNIAGHEREFIILSYHPAAFNGNEDDAVEGFLRAIEKHHKRIKIIGHICKSFSKEQSLKVIEQANKYNIPLELNGQYFKHSPENWRVLLDNANQIYINSDAHTLYEIDFNTKESRRILELMGYKTE